MLQPRPEQPNKKYKKKKKLNLILPSPLQFTDVQSFESIFQHLAVASPPWSFSRLLRHHDFKSLCASLVAQTVESACNVGALGLIPGSERSPGEGNGNPLQYSCLENPMDRGAWRATVHGTVKSWARLSNFTFTFHCLCHQPVSGWRYYSNSEAFY